QLQATVIGATASCDWSLEMDDLAWDGWDGASLTVSINGVPTVYTCTFNQTIVTLSVQAGDVISLNYSPGAFEDEVTYILFDDMGNIVFQDGPFPTVGIVWSGNATCNGQPGMTWAWTPTNGLSDPTIANPTVLVSSPTEFFVTAYPTGHPACAATDSVQIDLDPGLDPGTDSLVIVCATPPTFLMTDMLGGTPNSGGVWTDVNGNVVPNLFDPQVDPAGVYTYTVTTVLGCVGTADLEIQILPASDPSCCGVVDAGPDETVCTLNYPLSASVGNTGTGIWTGPAGYVFSDASNAQTMVTAPGSGPAMFYWTEDDGVLCHLIDSVTITFTEPLVATITTTDAICFEACDGLAHVPMTGGNGAFTYTWSDNLAGTVDVDASGICSGTYSLAVVDVNNCATTTDFTIGQPPLLEIDVTSYVEPWCHGDCNGSITITDAEAVEYSFDGGTTFTQNPTLDSLCTGEYGLAIRNADGCRGTAGIVLPEPPEVIAEFGHTPIPANVNAPTIFFHNLSENSVYWLWDIAGLRSTQERDPAFVFSEKEPGIYDVCLIAGDTHQCTDTICHKVIIDDVLFTYIPNSFTPDGDDVNEMWGMSTNIADIMNFELRVFDRWGQVIFATDDPTILWDGTYNNGGGEIVKEDVYAYRIIYQLISTGGVREHLGHVTLLK
ncbi:MAG TPA: gliding motility-associated C-terminal domain-containing protein, partial [Flavobacteriales bacterium]|nr:gliding motility-associated C-terminal domain-containing protein [Flavobacteriales bacterium]